MDRASSSGQKHILVLGCGVVGLNSALRLQQDIPGVQITIMAENLAEGTVSNVAAGIFRASTSIRGPTPQLTKKWIKESWCYYQNLKNNVSQKRHGIFDIPLYLITTKGMTKSNDVMTEVSSVTRKCTQNELNLFQPQGLWTEGNYYHTMAISPDYYLPWAKTQFLKKGGQLIQKRVEKLSDLANRGYDVVVNCTGLAAKWLCNDSKMSPIRGQVIKVRAPWIKLAIFADHDTYIIPGVDHVTLGGCRQYDDYNQEVRESDSVGIWERATTLVPSLKKAEVVYEAVGLRPFRTCVRVEKETMNNNLHVVHHYGHCGYGMLLSPGTSGTVSQLVQELLRGDLINHHLIGAKL